MNKGWHEGWTKGNRLGRWLDFLLFQTLRATQFTP